MWQHLLEWCDLESLLRLSLASSTWRRICQDLSQVPRADFSMFFSRVRIRLVSFRFQPTWLRYLVYATVLPLHLVIFELFYANSVFNR
jgi:hypothetical protein